VRKRTNNEGDNAMKSKILGLLAVVLALGPICSARAVTISSGSDAIINFDLSSSPTTIYQAYVNLQQAATGSIIWNLFDGLDGSGSKLSGGLTSGSFSAGQSYTLLIFAVSDPTDGRFSFRLGTNLTTPINLDFCAQTANSSTAPCYSGTLSGTVPEPGSLALLGLGLAGLGMSRRRKVN
jgi:PEP-CTERM motif